MVTDSALVGSLAVAKLHISVVHVEEGMLLLYLLTAEECRRKHFLHISPV